MGSDRKEKFMTKDDMQFVTECINKLNLNQAGLADVFDRWEKEEESYKGDQPIIDKRPNSRINIINANIEGQISALVEQNITVTTRGESPSDDRYAEWARIGLDWTLRKNRIKKVIEQHERRRLKFGSAFFKLYFDETAIKNFGLVTIVSPPLTRIFVDNKIKDALRLQEAEYIAEPIRFSKTQFIELYGEEKAEAITYGNVVIENTVIFDEKYTEDEETGATLIQWWEKPNGKLRLVEFSGCGILLYDSFKSGDRKTNQKNKEYSKKSYYKFVNNKYPYFFTPLYPEEGNLRNAFGDGKLLRPIQDIINDLYDKIRICARPNLVLVNVDSEVDANDYNENSLEPRPYSPCAGDPVLSVPWGQINPAWWQLLVSIHEEAQRVTRFSDLMIGQRTKAETATEAAIQQQQGNATTDHKKIMLEETLTEVCEYALGLMMEFYKEGKAFRLSDDQAEFEWIDFRQFNNVPVMKPSTQGFRKKYKEKNPSDTEYKNWEPLEENGITQTKSVDLDIEISIGAGMPKNKTFLWQMIERISSIISVDKTGMQKPVIYWDELRQFIKDFLGLPLPDDANIPQVMGTIPQPQQPSQYPQYPVSADSPLSQNENPMMNTLPPDMRGGAGY